MKITDKHVLRIGLICLGLLIIGLFVKCPRNESLAKTETRQKNIDSSKIKIDQYEKIISQNQADILALQNKLHKVSVDFSNYKKTPKYKQRIDKIKASVPIDTLAANTIELEVCKTESLIKDTIITAYAKKDTLFSLQKTEFQSIIDNQKEIINIHVKEILQEQKQTKKEKRAKNFWKITTAAVIGAYIHKTVK